MAVKKISKNKYLVDYRDITGKRVRKTFYTKYEADSFYNEVQLNKNKGLSCTVDKNLTVAQACEYYLEKHIKLHCKEKTIGENTRIINNHIFRHTYQPRYTCCEENVVTNQQCGSCCQFR